MKLSKVILFLILTMAGAAFGQVPQGIPYQAVARNASGQPLSNQNIIVKFSILDNTVNGPAIYVEKHLVTTNAFGLFTLDVGMGSSSWGTFSSINWGVNAKYLKVELDTTGTGSNFIDIGTQRMMSVPYALYAGNIAANGRQGQILTMCNGQPVWTSGGVCPGMIASLACSSAVIAGSLIMGTPASGVSAAVSYTGGNGGVYYNQSVFSMGVTGLTASISGGSFASGPGTITYTITGTPSSAGTASFAIGLGGQTCMLNVPVYLPGATLASLSCSTAVITGSLTNSIPASGVTVMIPYTGGNGGGYDAQIIPSTGVGGLTATRPAGAVTTGSGGLTYTITGTPADTGTASFAITLGGQSCTFSVPVMLQPAVLNTINCGSATVIGNLVNGNAVTNSTASVPYTGGNGGSYAAQSISSTGVTGLIAALPAGNLASGSGSVVFTITGTPSGIGTATFAIVLGGRSCTLSMPVALQSASFSALACSSAVNSGSVTFGTPATGVSVEIPYSGGNGGGYDAIFIQSSGVTGLTATLAADTLANGTGSLVFTINGTPSATGNAIFTFTLAGSSCTFSIPVSLPPPTISTLACSSALINGMLTSGVAASGVSVEIAYTGGNGMAYGAQAIASSGVSGLTATLDSGVLAAGSGSLVYTIAGTPVDSGTANFSITLGGQSCTFGMTVNPVGSNLYPPGTVFCSITSVVDVTNPITGKIWMDRNLGATAIPTGLLDTNMNTFGDLYQWGRGNDGHQCRNSPVTTVLSSSDQPGHGSFIAAGALPFDWRATQNNLLWQGVNGINNPCPNGYRIPTRFEWEDERFSWNYISGYYSPLRLVRTSGRVLSGAYVSNYALYWSSTPNTSAGLNSFIYALDIPVSSGAFISNVNRAFGCTVRCIKD